MSPRADSEDIIQEVFLKGFQRFHQLSSQDSFKAWMLTIARNEVNEYFRSRPNETSLETVEDWQQAHDSHDRYGTDMVRETMNALADKDREILYLYY